MSTARGRLRALVRNRILGRAAAIVGMGVQARAVLTAQGVPATRIVDAPNATDVALIESRLAAQRDDGSITRLRKELGDGKRIALFCGRLVPFKGLVELLAGWRALPAELRETWRLCIVGDGPLAPLVDEAGRHSDILRKPGVPMRDVPGHYAAADLHLFPSLADAWGLTVQEAMLCGVPTLCSVHAGCADDLVADGEDGLLFDPSTPASMLTGLERALRHPDLPRLGARAVDKARLFTPERLAESFRSAVTRALETRAGTTPATTLRTKRATT